MLAALLTNLEQPDKGLPADAIKRWKDAHRKQWEVAEERIRRQRADELKRREHLEDAYRRLMGIPEARAKLEPVLPTGPNFRIIARNEEVTALITALYLEYLEDEDIIILAMSLV